MSRLAAVAAAAFITLAHPVTLRAQSAAVPLPVVNTPWEPQTTGSQQKLLRLVAPVALYPDTVLTDVLAAATYPAQVVEAQRFIADPAHASLQGEALAAAAAEHGWDESVTALLAFPQILQMMDARLEWTEQLGHAFVAQQADVMSAIQTLRRQAQAAGNLSNGPQDVVVNDGGDIAISPPSQQMVYLPAYNPDCVYGPAPDCTPDQAYVGWDDAVFLPFGFTQWGLVDWGSGDILLGGIGLHNDRPRDPRVAAFGGSWHHPSPHPFASDTQGSFDDRYDHASAAQAPRAFTGAYSRAMPQAGITMPPVFRVSPRAQAPAFRQAAPVAIAHSGHVGRR